MSALSSSPKPAGAALLLALALAPGCGDETTEEGPLRPPPNGVRVSEMEACETLRAALVRRREALGCSLTTTRTCPQLLRVLYDPDCVEFDEGSVKGCAAHLSEQPRCEDLEPALSSCVVTTYPGSEPAGCP